MTEIEKLLLNALETLQDDHQKTVSALSSELESLTKLVRELNQQLITESKKTEDLMRQFSEFNSAFTRLTKQ
ncbi:TPA: hypothetical protein MJB77_27320 [Klebsiella pneumoniae]|nr:hypothetical protein [Klebsiella pneumoniae]HBZ0630903.1 hypothetical protein [Klebsiella pneumoniae]HDQ2700209.1 hypothetical protein [Klebsiella pneumoniae]